MLVGCGENPAAWPAVTFDKAKWATTEDEKRFVFARDLIEQKRLHGMSKQEVVDVLGSPSFADSRALYVTYVLKVSSGNLYILDVRFKQRDKMLVVDDVFVRAD